MELEDMYGKEYLPVVDLDFKAAEDDSGTFTGYASTFRNEDLVRDIVDPGAFTRTLQKSKGIVPVLMSHMGSQMVGIGMEAHEDAKGLFVKGEFTLENQHGANAYASAKHAKVRGLKLGLSIGYGIAEGGATWDEKRGVRHLKDIDLYEYSIAPVPANPRASVTGVKSLYGKRAVEAWLIEKGFSRSDAVGMAAELYGVVQRDAERTGKTHTDALRDAAAYVQREAAPFPPVARNGSLLVAELRAALL